MYYIKIVKRNKYLNIRIHEIEIQENFQIISALKKKHLKGKHENKLMKEFLKLEHERIMFLSLFNISKSIRFLNLNQNGLFNF